MLPSYSRGHKEKVERDYGSGSYPAGRAFSIQPHKFQPRSQPAMRKRRALIYRLAMAGSLLLTAFFFFVPSARPSWVPPVGLGLFSSSQHMQLETVRYYDLANVEGTAMGWEREERILLCAPLRDASPHLPMFFSHLKNLTYPHNLIDLAFLVGDSKDNTLQLLHDSLTALQEVQDPALAFGEISVIEKDFGQKVNQDVESRHGFAAQASRRKSMAQARNWLLSAALRPTHSWVYWRDVDVETAPFTILEDLMRHNKDVIVPNVWRPLPDWLGGEQPYDLNSWQESETALALADTLDEDAVIVEGYAEYATWRPHLAYLRDPYGDPDMEMEIDGVGGVSILAKAKVFRSGVHFPAFSFEKHAETEGFGKMAKRMKYSVIGLPHYTIWHLYEPSVDDLRHMEEMEKERIAREAEEKLKKERAEKISVSFDDSTNEWQETKALLKAEDDMVAKSKLQQKAADAKADAVAAYDADPLDVNGKAKKVVAAAVDDDLPASKPMVAKDLDADEKPKKKPVVDADEEDVAPAHKKPSQLVNQDNKAGFAPGKGKYDEDEDVAAPLAKKKQRTLTDDEEDISAVKKVDTEARQAAKEAAVEKALKKSAAKAAGAKDDI